MGVTGCRCGRLKRMKETTGGREGECGLWRERGSGKEGERKKRKGVRGRAGLERGIKKRRK